MINNKSDTINTKYHRKLNKEQLNILKFLYEFRFVHCKQIAKYRHKQNIRLIQKQFKGLEDQKLIAKRYDSSYKLRGKPAAYYILPAGARVLGASTDRDPAEPINFKRIYKEKDVSEDFIFHCLNILNIYLELHASFPDLVFAPKFRLNYEHYEYFPHPLPDVYIQIEAGSSDTSYFLDIFEEQQPYFVLVRRIKQYITYSQSGVWDDIEPHFPIVLIVCANRAIQKRLRRRISRELQESYEQITFATTTIAEVIDQSQNTQIWRPIYSYGDTYEDPIGLDDFETESNA
jgi:hypothetical protein